MNQRRKTAIALFVAALIPLSFFCVSMLVAWRAYVEANSFSGSHFFRICSSSAGAECTSFTWVQLLVFCLISLFAGALLAVIAIRKWKSTTAFLP